MDVRTRACASQMDATSTAIFQITSDFFLHRPNAIRTAEVARASPPHTPSPLPHQRSMTSVQVR